MVMVMHLYLRILSPLAFRAAKLPHSALCAIAKRWSHPRSFVELGRHGGRAEQLVQQMVRIAQGTQQMVQMLAQAQPPRSSMMREVRDGGASEAARKKNMLLDPKSGAKPVLWAGGGGDQVQRLEGDGWKAKAMAHHGMNATLGLTLGSSGRRCRRSPSRPRPSSASSPRLPRQ